MRDLRAGHGCEVLIPKQWLLVELRVNDDVGLDRLQMPAGPVHVQVHRHGKARQVLAVDQQRDATIAALHSVGLNDESVILVGRARGEDAPFSGQH